MGRGWCSRRAEKAREGRRRQNRGIPRRIYLDHAATAPLSPRARARMVEAMDRFGNPSSGHAEGRAARQIADRCRAELVRRANEAVAGGGYGFADVVFTGGGTEGANLALVGGMLAVSSSGSVHVSPTEHACVHGTIPLLRRLGIGVEIGVADALGRLSWRADVREAAMIVAMAANNELGSMNDLPAIAELCRSNGALFACDGVQGFGKMRFGAKPDLLWISAHKIGGPKGVGALLFAPGVEVRPLVAGGEQERGRRGGTENTIGLAGFLGALEDLDDLATAGVEARDVFWDRLVADGGVPTISDRAAVLGGHAHFRFPGVAAETLLARLDIEGVSASAGAACAAGSVEASHVMMSIGYSDREASEGVRFTFGRGNSVEEAERAAGIVLDAVEEIPKTSVASPR